MESQTIPVVTWQHLPEMSQLTGTTIPIGGRRFFLHSDTTILKLGTEQEEGIMTQVAHNRLGPEAPAVHALVEITDPPTDHGVLLSRRPGTPLVELWSSLSADDQARVKISLTELLVRMRNSREKLEYYGRPGGRPYVTLSELSGPVPHAYCHNCSDWNTSRISALRDAAEEIQLSHDRVLELEQIQNCTVADGATLVVLPVLTHGDLSNRNILVDPVTMEVTGLIDWELAAVTPAYFEYALARLSGGHDAAWRQVLLEVLRGVLRIECKRHSSTSATSQATGSEQLFNETLKSWNILVDVERAAQGYSDDCYWTFEDGLPPTSPESLQSESALATTLL